MSVQLDIARRVAAHLTPGEVVNLGIGIPTLVADAVDLTTNAIFLQTENGMLGVGPTPSDDAVDPMLVNAGKLPITALPGSSYFSSAVSFGLIRGGHVTTSILGALQIDAAGRVANWAAPGKPILGVGGAMDLLVGAKRVIVATTHLTRDGEPKIVSECTMPLTADRSVDLVVTEAATFAVREGRLVLIEVTDADWVRAHTLAPYDTDGVAT